MGMRFERLQQRLVIKRQLLRHHTASAFRARPAAYLSQLILGFGHVRAHTYPSSNEQSLRGFRGPQRILEGQPSVTAG